MRELVAGPEGGEMGIGDIVMIYGLNCCVLSMV